MLLVASCRQGITNIKQFCESDCRFNKILTAGQPVNVVKVRLLYAMHLVTLKSSLAPGRSTHSRSRIPWAVRMLFFTFSLRFSIFPIGSVQKDGWLWGQA